MRQRRKNAPRRLTLRPIAVGALLLLAVVLGLLLPGLSAGLQSRNTDRLSRTVDLGQASLSLTSDEAKLEKLSILGEIAAGSGNYVELETEGRFMTAADVAAKFDALAALLNGTDLSLHGLERSDVLDVEPVLLVAASGPVSTSLVWVVNGGKVLDADSGYHYEGLQYVVDDATGLILGAEFRRYRSEELTAYQEKKDWSRDAQRLVENLAASYAFSDTVMGLGGSSAIDANTDLYYVNYATGSGRVLGLPLVLGEDRWAINLYSD